MLPMLTMRFQTRATSDRISAANPGTAMWGKLVQGNFGISLNWPPFNHASHLWLADGSRPSQIILHTPGICFGRPRRPFISRWRSIREAPKAPVVFQIAPRTSGTMLEATLDLSVTLCLDRRASIRASTLSKCPNRTGISMSPASQWSNPRSTHPLSTLRARLAGLRFLAVHAPDGVGVNLSGY